MADDEIRLVFSRRQVKAGLFLGILLGLAYGLHSATIKFSTTYPSPSGVYRKLISTSDTFLAREGGKVGIGTSLPQAKLDVNGAVRVGSLGSDPETGADGTLYYNTARSSFRARQSGAWADLSATRIVTGYCSGTSGTDANGSSCTYAPSAQYNAAYFVRVVPRLPSGSALKGFWGVSKRPNNNPGLPSMIEAEIWEMTPGHAIIGTISWNPALGNVVWMMPNLPFYWYALY